jgi:hypothetical protein
VPERQFPLADSFSSVQQRLMNVFASEVRMLGKDLIGRHAVRDHRYHRGYWEAHPPDAWQAAHDVRVGGDSLEDHASIISAADLGTTFLLRTRFNGHVARSASPGNVEWQLAARLYGQICAAVRVAGREPRKRASDLMIAATAASNQLPLYTANSDDFKGSEGFVEVVAVQARSNNL